MRIISGSFFKPYEDLLEDIEEETLLGRQNGICLTFAQKCVKNEKFSSWFPKSVSTGSGFYYFFKLCNTLPNKTT